jgi:hypothetical protein
MRAIQEPNVDVHFTAVNKITEDSVIDTEGTEKKVDTIICATGFDVSYKPRFPIVGQNGVELREKVRTASAVSYRPSLNSTQLEPHSLKNANIHPTSGKFAQKPTSA